MRKLAFVRLGCPAAGSCDSYAQVQADAPAACLGLGIPFCCEPASSAPTTALNI